MGRQGELITKRLRRLARALVDDVDSADGLVLDTLSAAEERPSDLYGLFALMIQRRRSRPPVAYRRRRPHGQADVVRAFEALPLQDREVMALAIIEELAYEDAARVLDIPTEQFLVRLTQARTAFGRLADGERHVVLRLVK
jgi:DNA-directed RNA polymerase specialized sigma24 family protein